jgi:hypothetical protein
MALSVYATLILKQLLRQADLGLLSCRSAHRPLSVSKVMRLTTGVRLGKIQACSLWRDPVNWSSARESCCRR